MSVMDESEQHVNSLAQLLRQTLDPSARKQAENDLRNLETRPNFSLIILKLIESSTMDPTVRFVGSVYFKNFVKKHWKQVEGETDNIPAQDRDFVKAHIVDLMIMVPNNIQLQLSEAVTIIADNDFPYNWENLIEILVKKLQIQDFNVINGVLQTAHSIFKRWRGQFRSDALFSEIKFVLQQFCVPFMELFRKVDALIDQQASDPAALKVLFNSLLLIVKIFYSLNSQDIPEFFEDNHESLFALLHKYLIYKNPALETDDDEEAGPIEKVKSNICEVIDLYAKRYEDEFTKLPQFVDVVWHLLTNIGKEPKNDELVGKALAFLTSVVKPARHKPFFEAPETLRSICEKIVLPNMELRETDEELFEDDPIEFLRRDLEGSDNDTRRRAASDLVRGLLEHFAKEVTEIFSHYVGAYLENYEKNRSGNWKAKDTALYLITALSAKTLAAQTGATSVNEYIQILPVFSAHVLPELQAPVDGSVNPIIKVDAIKYLLVFRSQLTKQQLVEVLPLLMNHLTSRHYVVYTYAAVCIERILAIRSGNTLMFGKEDIKPFAQSLLVKLFELVERSGATPEKLAENDYLMKTVMRVIVMGKEDMAPFVGELINRFVKIIEVISKNPSNPKFNHYVFESLGALVRYACAGNPTLTQQVESMLFPPFQAILQLDITDFMPYVFQILSQCLEYHQPANVPEAYQAMLQPLLMPPLWESFGNIPPLVRLLQAYLSKMSKIVVQRNLLPAFLGIFQKLIASRINDQYGYELIECIVENIPSEHVMPYMKNILVLVLNRLQMSKTPKLTKGFLQLVCFMLTLDKPGWNAETVVQLFESLQPKLLVGLLRQILIPELALPLSKDERKIAIVAMTKLLTQSPTIQTAGYQEVWSPLLVGIVELCEAPLAEQSGAHDDDEYVLDNEEAGYQTSYARLASVGKQKRDPVAAIPDEKVYLAQSLSQSQKLLPVLQGLPVELQSNIQKYFQAANIAM